ncbi:MAG: hypothetical protein WDZ37_01740 [Solirubrobacterales bacterium]
MGGAGPSGGRGGRGGRDGRRFWGSVAAAIAALARRTGCSIEQSPLPEIREVGRDWHEADLSLAAKAGN